MGALVTLRGQNFTNQRTADRSVELRPTDSSEPWKSVHILSWTENAIEWHFPCWTFAPSNYDVTVKTEAGRSNKRVFTKTDGGGILSLRPTLGPYGTWIEVSGSCLSLRNNVFEDDYHGVRGILTFTNASGTWIATKFMTCGSLCIKVRFQDFYQDRNGNFLQDVDEPFSSPAEFTTGNYGIRNKVIYFGDEDGSGNFSSGDTVFNISESPSQTFTLTDWPIIYRLRPAESEPGNIVKIVGYNFGNTQGDSVVHIGDKMFNSSSPRVRLWSNTTIKVRIPNYKCEWFHMENYKTTKVWITVNGTDSNKKLLKVLKPSTCSSHSSCTSCHF